MRRFGEDRRGTLIHICIRKVERAGIAYGNRLQGRAFLLDVDLDAFGLGTHARDVFVKDKFGIVHRCSPYDTDISNIYD